MAQQRDQMPASGTGDISLPDEVLSRMSTETRGLAEAVMLGFEVAKATLPIVPYLSQKNSNSSILARRPALVVAEITPVVYAEPRPADILQLVARKTEIPPEEIISATLTRTVVAARQVAMLLTSEVAGMSSAEVGKVLGGRDHTTVLSGIKKVKAKAATDPSFALQLDRMRELARTSLREETGPSSVVLLTSGGLEQAGYKTIEQDAPSVLQLREGEQIFVQLPDSSSYDEVAGLWSDYGQMAADGLHWATRD